MHSDKKQTTNVRAHTRETLAQQYGRAGIALPAPVPSENVPHSCINSSVRPKTRSGGHIWGLHIYFFWGSGSDRSACASDLPVPFQYKKKDEFYDRGEALFF